METTETVQTEEVVKTAARIPAEFKQIFKCAAPEHTRHAINGVYVSKPNGVLRVEACDGRRLVRVTQQQPDTLEAEGRIVVQDGWSLAFKSAGAKRGYATFETGDDVGTCTLAGLPTECMDGHFPNTDDILKVETQRERRMVCVSVKLLRGILDAVAPISETIKIGVVNSKDCAKRPVLLTAHNAELSADVESLLMPINLES